MEEEVEANTNPERQREAKKYNKISRWIQISEFLLGILFILILLFLGFSARIRDFSLNYTNSPWILILLYLFIVSVIYEIFSFPLDFYDGFVLEHKFNLSNQKWGGWLKDHLKGTGVGFMVGLILVEILYFLLRDFPWSWWFIAALVFILLLILFSKIFPLIILPLFFKFTPLEDEELKGRLLELASKAQSSAQAGSTSGRKIIGVFKWGLEEKTKKANAALTGWGRTKRIILSDTLLKDYTTDEIETILAHELGHFQKRHIWQNLCIQAVLSFLGWYCAYRILNLSSGHFNLKGIDDIAGLPLIALIFSVLSLIFLPWANLYSRFLERDADISSLELTQKPDAFISSMKKLTAQNLAEYQPNKIIEFIFHSHPSMAKRIKLAKEFKKEHM
jgi:STE24 endopeptidase